MGGVPPKHLSSSKVRRRRSQQALKKIKILACSKCQGPTLPHKSCPQCGVHSKAQKINKPPKLTN